MESARRGYKLQFVAHASDVNCLNIGKKSCRVFVTGGVDRKVNLWAIGQPAALLSLSGHTSSVESVSFDSAEVLVLAGAYSGTVKLWDLEEAKLVRTLTGHRASCTSVEFHPFGEFFASGSLDTDLKIWDIRRKGCIHTYQGHTRAIKTVKFTPDGRWVVSGGEDNVVKLWDLTAGKLLHEFKFHTGQIQSIDFHPHEFLLATGSADRTVKFFDLETFELIGSAGPEMTGVRSMIFHPDGKALFCGLDETLKVFSWEPIRCHDVVDMRWSILGDLSIYEGKLLGCSYHQSSVGVWVADISLIAPYAIGVVPRTSGLTEPIYNPGEGHAFHHSSFESDTKLVDKVQDCGDETKETIKSVYVASNDSVESASRSVNSMGNSNISQRNTSGLTGNKCISNISSRNSLQNSDTSFASKVSPPNSNSVREIKAIESYSGTPRRIDSSLPPRRVSQNSGGFSARSSSISKDSREAHRGSKVQVINSPVSMPVVIPRDSPNLQNMANARKENANKDNVCDNISFKRSHSQGSSYGDIGNEAQKNLNESVSLGAAPNDLVGVVDLNFHSMCVNDVAADTDENCTALRTVAEKEKFKRIFSRERPLVSHSDEGHESVCSSPEKVPVKYVRGVAVQHGRTRSLVESWERFKGSSATAISSSSNMISGSENVSSSTDRLVQASERDLRSNDDGCSDALLHTHDSFINVLKSRLTKLQMVRHLWAESGMKGAITAVAKLPDHSVQIDVISILRERIELFTLDLFSSLLPLLAGLLNSKTERHIDLSLEMLLKLVRTFGPVIRSTVSASTPVGIDIQAEQRRDRCQLCSNQLQKIKQVLPSLIKWYGGQPRVDPEACNVFKQKEKDICDPFLKIRLVPECNNPRPIAMPHTLQKGGSIAKHALELTLALDG